MNKFIQIIPAPSHLSYELETSEGLFEYPVDIIGLTDDGEIVACAFDSDGCCSDVADGVSFVRIKFNRQFPVAGASDSIAQVVDVESTPAFVRLSEAARRAGITPDLFLEAVQSGAINIELIKLGERSHYFRSSQLEKWLQGY